MSYASVAATNAPPPSQQPHPDPALLNTESPSTSNVADDALKVNVVSPDFKSDAHTTYSETPKFSETPGRYAAPTSKGGHPDRHAQVHKHIHDAEQEGLQIWETAKQYLFRPGVAGGLIGIVNIGVFAAIGQTLYSRPELRRDASTIATATIGSIALLSAEGYAAEQYRKTPRGQQEERRAKEEGALIYKHLHEQLLRPGVLGGLVGLVNTAILGGVGYITYTNWSRPWDRRVVTAVSVGLVTLWGGEGILAERYMEGRSRN